jgi:hypothetical protein
VRKATLSGTEMSNKFNELMYFFLYPSQGVEVKGTLISSICLSACLPPFNGIIYGMKHQNGKETQMEEVGSKVIHFNSCEKRNRQSLLFDSVKIFQIWSKTRFSTTPFRQGLK